jgi:hypothetical protein
MPVYFSAFGQHALVTGGRGGGAEISATFASPAGVGVRAASRIGSGAGSQR